VGSFELPDGVSPGSGRKRFGERQQMDRGSLNAAGGQCPPSVYVCVCKRGGGREGEGEGEGT